MHPSDNKSQLFLLSVIYCPRFSTHKNGSVLAEGRDRQVHFYAIKNKKIFK